MPKSKAPAGRDGRQPSGGQGPRTRFETIVKWVGGITAILSLVFALHQITQLVSDVRDRQRQVAELHKVGTLQRGAADYAGAWASFEQALKIAESGGRLAKLTGQLSEEARQLRTAQEDLAMDWLENVHTSEGQTFSGVVDRLAPVLNRGAAGSSSARKADLLAHLGWVQFLRSRDGQPGLNPEQHYRQALEIDPANPYAHAYWGHWILWRRERLEDARQHFSSAIASGRARDHVRRIQLAALRNSRPDGDGEFLAVVNDMRKNNETVDSSVRNDFYGIYTFLCVYRHDAERLGKLLAVVPATEQVATYQALFYGPHDEDFDKWKRPGRDACLATLMEAAGQREDALRAWRALREGTPAKNGDALRDRADDAIRRLSARR